MEGKELAGIIRAAAFGSPQRDRKEGKGGKDLREGRARYRKGRDGNSGGEERGGRRIKTRKSGERRGKSSWGGIDVAEKKVTSKRGGGADQWGAL